MDTFPVVSVYFLILIAKKVPRTDLLLTIVYFLASVFIKINLN